MNLRNRPYYAGDDNLFPSLNKQRPRRNEVKKGRCSYTHIINFAILVVSASQFLQWRWDDLNYYVLGFQVAFSALLLLVFVTHIVEVAKAAKRLRVHHCLTVVRVLAALLAVLTFIAGHVVNFVS